MTLGTRFLARKTEEMETCLASMLHGPESKGIAEVGASRRPGLPNMKPSTGHVLYIEDDEDTRELVKYALGMSNYKVIAAAKLEDALRAGSDEPV